MTTKKEWLRNFCNTESWYAKDLQAALAEWDQLDAENIVLKEMLNQYRTDFRIQNEGIAKLQHEIASLKRALVEAYAKLEAADNYLSEKTNENEMLKLQLIQTTRI